MTEYRIDIRPDETIEEFEVTLRGPGIEGRRYIFRHPDRAEAFAETVNFVYQQGFRDGRQSRRPQDHRYFVVAGNTPENLRIEPEHLWARFRRFCRSLR